MMTSRKTLGTTSPSRFSSQLLLNSVLCATCVLSVGLATGCQDSAAAQRDEAQRTISQASVDFRQATAGAVVVGEEDFQSRMRELNSVISRMSNLSDAQPGQQAAGAMLAAEALGELASLHGEHAQHLMREHHYARASITSELDGADRLHAMATAQDRLTLNTQRTSLRNERQAAEQALQTLSQRINSLDGPIADRTQRNTEATGEARELRTEANDLLRRAIELGHAAGFPSFQRAIETRRDADGLDYEVALRELELEYELQPEHNLAQTQQSHLQQLVQSIRATLDEFDRLEQTLRADLQTTRNRVNELTSQINEAVSALNRDYTEALSEQFEQASSYAERAATQARQAAGRLRGEEANAARMLQAKAHEMHGRLLAAEANAAAAHNMLMHRLIAARETIGNVSEYESMADSLEQAHERLVEEATAAFNEAINVLSQVSGRAANNTEAFRNSLERATAQITGQQRPTQRSGRSGDRGESGGTHSGQGFASVDVAIAFLESLDSESTSDVDRLLNALHGSGSREMAMVEMMRDLTYLGIELERAVVSQFPDADSSDTGFGAPSFSNVRIEEESSDRVTLVFDDSSGPDSFDLIPINGVWFIDIASMMEDDMPFELGDAEAVRNLNQAITNTFQQLIDRLHNGEFQSIDQFDNAFMQAMMQMMMQMMQ
jgi:hypothetical protein